MFLDDMGRVFRWLAAPFLLLIALSAFIVLIRACFQHAFSAALPGAFFPIWAALPLGFFLRALLAFLLQRSNRDNPMAFIDTLEHELTHALFGYLTFNPPLSLKATLQGDGEVLLKGQNPLTLLAPYFFPLWTLFIAAITAVLDHRYYFWGTAFTLILCGSFAFRLLAEYRWRQSDLHGYGFLFSTGFAATLLALCLGLVFSLLHLCPWFWFATVPSQSLNLIHWLWQHFQILTNR
jgi:hypothetical protein